MFFFKFLCCVVLAHVNSFGTKNNAIPTRVVDVSHLCVNMSHT